MNQAAGTVKTLKAVLPDKAMRGAPNRWCASGAGL